MFIKVDTTIKNLNLVIIDDPYNDYEWNILIITDGLIQLLFKVPHMIHGYIVKIWNWVFSFGIEQNFLYSEEHGWFYTMRFNDRNILYWYGRRYWLYAHDFWWKK